MGEVIAASNISVQLDVNSVPKPSAPQSRDEHSFAQSLDDAQRPSRSEINAQPRERVDSRNPEVQAQPEPRAETGAATPESGLTASQGDSEADAARPAPAEQAAATPLQAAIQDGSTGRRITAGKTPESPGASLIPGADAGTARPGSMTTPGSNAASPTTAAPALGPATAVAGTQSGDGAGSRLRVEQPGELRAGTRLTRGTGPRLRTYDAQAMELQLKTRDSVFKNIAMRLLPDGGEMRMRLDPPHLGNLDIKLVVEKGVVVQLSLGAERADVANMLDRSLPELKQFLESQGLSLGHSAVSTFEFAGQSHAHHSWGNGGNGSGAEDHEPEALTGALRSDFVTAEGLDFWA